MSLLEDRLFQWLESNGMFEAIDSVLLAVSGGADSAAMAHAMVNLRKRGDLSCNFVIGHVNHCLRGDESDGDEAFVTRLAQSLAVPVVTRGVDVRGYARDHKLSIETAGRNLRLQTLAALAEEQECDCVATAHHADDLAETIIHRLMRGTGFRGLCGILPVSHVYDAEFVRPMLEVRRDEIIQYCKENSIAWREDASNQNINFTRNRIRHQLMPVLHEESGEIVNKLQKLSGQCRRFRLFTEKLAECVLTKGRFELAPACYSIKADFMQEVACWVFYEVVRKALVKLGIGLRQYTREHFDAIRDMIGKDEAKADFPGQLQIIVKKGVVSFQKKSDISVLSRDPIELTIGQSVQFDPWKISSKLLDRADIDYEDFLKTKNTFVEWFDADRIEGPLEIRVRRDGDRFWPIGGVGEKKVGRFLIDARLDSEIKEKVFIVADAKKILWLAPLRMSELAKVTEGTCKILAICVELKKRFK